MVAYRSTCPCNKQATCQGCDLATVIRRRLELAAAEPRDPECGAKIYVRH